MNIAIKASTGTVDV